MERFAALPSPFTLADFGFSAQASVDLKLIADLGTLRLIDDATNVRLIGPPGVGKTMVAGTGSGTDSVAGGLVGLPLAGPLACTCCFGVRGSRRRPRRQRYRGVADR